MTAPAVIDFETHPIIDGVGKPPAPVGVSIFMPGDRKPKYWSWGHPTENNCSLKDGQRALASVWTSGKPLLFHNAKFDLAVGYEHLDLPPVPWELVHDTMFLIFLCDPHSPDLKLKTAAERLLGMPPEEQDILRDWCVEQRLIAKNVKRFGHLICKAPGALVGKYADGDTIRTKKLFSLLHKQVIARGMREPYDRERRLLPVLMKSEKQGVPVDAKAMKADVLMYDKAQLDVDAWLKKTLKVGADFNLDSDTPLADALVSSGAASEELFLRTPGGKRSVAKDSLIGAVTDKRILQALQYRSRLGTANGTFLKPWAAEAELCGGIVHPSWNQVRQSSTGASGSAGARTGRLSASRFMNVPKEFKEAALGKNAYTHPKHIKGLPELPFMRKYMLPFKGEVWGKRDYSAQELRVLAHFGDGGLMEAYHDNPLLDVHQMAADLIVERFGIAVTRQQTKTIGFGLLYGMGLGALAIQLGTDINTAKTIKNAYMATFPELDDLQTGLKEIARAGEFLTTWGGRQYFVEPPKFMANRGRVVTFEYKLLNYLIQGSSADCTKEAVIRYDEAAVHGRFLLMVHDEINISVPKSKAVKEMLLLRDVMASIEFDVVMLSDGALGPSWGDLTKLKEPALAA